MSEAPRTIAAKGLGGNCGTCVPYELSFNLETEKAELRKQLAAKDALMKEMAEALEVLAEWLDERWGDNECRPLENARAAIAKYRSQS